MNRKIQFRGKRIDTGEWVYGYYVADGDYHFIVSDLNGTIQWEVDPATVGQFTGMADSRGIDIYEGDIISSADRCFKHEIFYDEDRMAFKGKSGAVECEVATRWIDEFQKTVTGTIHD